MGLKLKNIFKALPSVIGAGVGMALGGPAGATIGGALGGSMSRGGQNKFKGALGGAGMGLGYSAFAPMAGNALGVSGAGPLSGVLGMNSPSLMSQLGVAGAPTTGGGLGLSALFGGGAQGAAGVTGSQAAQNNGAFGGLLGGGGINSLLLPLAVGGTLMRRERMPKDKQTLAEYIQQHKPQWSAADQPRYLAPLNRTIVPINPLANTEQLYFNDVNPYMG
jgi:hypothetical protein